MCYNIEKIRLESSMNYISISVYAVLFISFLIGIQVAPCGEFKKNSLSLDAMTSLKGVMAIFVLLHHISQKQAFLQTNTISFFREIGILFVGVFFFTSGYGLHRSFSTKPDYLKGFFKRRIFPIVCSYYVMVAVYAVYYVITKPGFALSEWICKLTGLTLINSQSWYVYVILIMYVSFYFIYKNEKLRCHSILIFTLITLLQALLFIVLKHFPWYAGEFGWWQIPDAFASVSWWKRPCALLFEGEWWVNSTICFVLGLAVAKYEKQFFQWVEKKYPLKFLTAVLVCSGFTAAGFYCIWNISYWTEFAGDFGISAKLICYIAQSFQVISTVLFIIIFMRKIYVKNRFYNFFGKISLEVYLMQEIVLFCWGELIESENEPVFSFGNLNIALYALLVVLTVLCSAIIYRAINVKLAEKLKNC